MPGFDGIYHVSDHGRVWSHARELTTRNRWGYMKKHLKAKLLSPYEDERGRQTIVLSVNGAKTRCFVHQLVMSVFVGPCPKGQEIAHNDGDPRNNRLDNLQYDTRKGNHYDKRRHGTHQAGERNPGAKINQRIADEIRALKGKIPSREAAFRYDLEKTTVLDIWSGKRWCYT